MRKQSGTSCLRLRGSAIFSDRGMAGLVAWYQILLDIFRNCTWLPLLVERGGGSSWRWVELMMVTRLRVVTFERRMSRRLRYNGAGDSKEVEIWRQTVPSLGDNRLLTLFDLSL